MNLCDKRYSLSSAILDPFVLTLLKDTNGDKIYRPPPFALSVLRSLAVLQKVKLVCVWLWGPRKNR